MKYTSFYSKKERVYFTIREAIVSEIYNRFSKFIETSFYNPNQIFMGPKAYNELMKVAYDKDYQPESDFGTLMGMKVNVSSKLMENDIILLRTIE